MRPFDLLRTKCLEEGCGTTLCDVLKLKIPKSVGYLNGTLHGLSLLVGCRPLLFTGIRVVLVVPTSLVHLWKYFHPRFHHELIFFSVDSRFFVQNRIHSALQFIGATRLAKRKATSWSHRLMRFL